MSPESIESIKQSLLDKGYNQTQIDDIISLIPIEAEVINPQKDTLESFVTNLLKEPKIHDLAKQLLDSIENEKERVHTRELKFHSFLSRIDLIQKAYNILFVGITCAIIYFLKRGTVISGETAQTVVVLIIGLSMKDAISSFYKSSKSSSFNEE